MLIINKTHFTYLKIILQAIYKSLEEKLDCFTDSRKTFLEFFDKFISEFSDLVEDRNIRKVDFFFLQLDYLLKNYYAAVRRDIWKEYDTDSTRRSKFKAETLEIEEARKILKKMRLFVIECMNNKTPSSTDR